MSHRTALVTCRACAGTGLREGGLYQCGVCLGQMHIAVDRTSDGGIPDGETEWKEIELPALVPNPPRLTFNPSQDAEETDTPN